MEQARLHTWYFLLLFSLAAWILRQISARLASASCLKRSLPLSLRVRLPSAANMTLIMLQFNAKQHP